MSVSCAYILGELKESLGEFLVISLKGGTAIAPLCVAAAHHIMQLRSADQTIICIQEKHTPIINTAIRQPLYSLKKNKVHFLCVLPFHVGPLKAIVTFVSRFGQM